MLQIAVDCFVYGILKFSPESHFAGALDFFLYDSIKILILLFGMITLMGFLRSYLPQEKLHGWLNSRKQSYFYAACFGALTPFCSCSSIPIFMSFLRAGVPLGVSFSFLITSPIINEYLVVLMVGFFGLKITGWYILSGLAIGFLSGLILGRMHLEKYVVEDMATSFPSEQVVCSNGFLNRIRYGLSEAITIVRKLWAWILFGVAVGALIHNYVPQELIQSVIGKAGFFSVPAAVILGVPLYGSCAAIVPIAVALFQKGVPLGTALAFMMAISALSLPEAVMLRRAMKLPLIALFFGITAFSIILTGYFLNFLQAFGV